MGAAQSPSQSKRSDAAVMPAAGQKQEAAKLPAAPDVVQFLKELNFESYTVKAGDNFHNVLRSRGLLPLLPELAKFNDLADPSKLKIGQNLKLPQFNESYDVKKGDTFWGILKERGLLNHSKTIAKINGLDDPSKLEIGQTLSIPRFRGHGQEVSPRTGLTEMESSVYQGLRGYLGAPYGPKYPKYNDPAKRDLEHVAHYDCISLVKDYFKTQCGVTLTGAEGDKWLARHSHVVGKLSSSSNRTDLACLKPGQMVCFGRDGSGEGGYDIRHLGIVAKVITDGSGATVDAMIVNASGSYNKGRTEWWGRGVVEQPLSEMMKAYRGGNKHFCYVADVVKPSSSPANP